MNKKSDIRNTNIELTLNSFVRRTQNTDQLKELIKSFQGELKRAGRSRNWKLTLPYSTRSALIKTIYEADQPSWLWFAKKLAEQTQEYEQSDLVQIIRENPSITINELIELSNCTTKEARIALDEFEWQTG